MTDETEKAMTEALQKLCPTDAFESGQEWQVIMEDLADLPPAGEHVEFIAHPAILDAVIETAESVEGAFTQSRRNPLTGFGLVKVWRLARSQKD